MHTIPSQFYGLSDLEVQNRLRKFGPNEIKAREQKTAWWIFLSQLRSPLVLILLVACGLSTLLGDFSEAIAIFAILALNAVVGFFQENRAENAIHALRCMTAPRARVIREGVQREIPARELAPGDLLLLESGDIVAADGRLLLSANLQINEAVLTGESLPVEKQAEGVKAGALANQSGIVFMGTSITAGTGLAEITTTGMETELGRIAHLVSTVASPPTPLQLQLRKLGGVLLLFCISAAALEALLWALEGREWPDILIFSISLAVAVVPEGMPAIVTVALAMGVQRMARRNALIRKLSSVETLGSVTVICTDKTGTLTTGKMRVRELWGEDIHALVQSAASCCDAELDASMDGGLGDPTEIAILLAARELGMEKSKLENMNRRLVVHPFDSVRKRMSIQREDGRLYVKGAIESLLDISNQDAAEKAELRRANQQMTAKGLRVLAAGIGSQPEERDIEIIGLIGLADPPREKVVQAIAEARAAGILSVMITGDHPLTANAIAQELGLLAEGEGVEGRVHARATPEDKMRLVQEWKNRGAVVAMTGDGVNDAPALREAHVGIAMGRSGTEVTRQSADLILADDNFATIVAAVKEGRGVFQNIRKAVLYLLTGNFAELLVILGASAFGAPLPLTAAHLLWINLVTDSLPGLALIADPPQDHLMKQAPRPSSEPLLGRPEWRQLIWQASLEGGLMLFLYFWLLREVGLRDARSLVFSTFVLSQLLRSFGSRSRSRFFWEFRFRDNFWLVMVVFFSATLQLSLHFIPFSQNIFDLTPISWSWLVYLLPTSFATITAIELLKFYRRKRGRVSLGKSSPEAQRKKPA